MERARYFRAMFRSGMREAAAVEVEVPDGGRGVARALAALYSRVLEDGDDRELLEDLVTADRYGFAGVKRLASAACAGAGPAARVAALCTARRVDAPRLYRDALSRAAADVGELAGLPDFPDLAAEDLGDLCATLMKARPHLLRPAPPPPPPFDPDRVVTRAGSGSLLTLRHALALAALSVLCVLAQRHFRFGGPGAVSVVNLVFMALAGGVFWHSGKVKARARK